jgi:hypothetical protein
MPWPDEPQWIDRKKHKPPPRVAWAKLVVDTAGSDTPAFYCFDVDIETLEMDCVRKGITQGREIVKPENERHPYIREFWMHCGRIIGASNGKETEYMFAQWEACGSINEVHGRPITIEELRQRGVRV